MAEGNIKTLVKSGNTRFSFIFNLKAITRSNSPVIDLCDSARRLRRRRVRYVNLLRESRRRPRETRGN